MFFLRPSPKAGRELQTDFDMMRRDEEEGPLAKNQPEPVTGPWVYTETVYFLLLQIADISMQLLKNFLSLIAYCTVMRYQ